MIASCFAFVLVKAHLACVEAFLFRFAVVLLRLALALVLVFVHVGLVGGRRALGVGCEPAAISRGVVCSGMHGTGARNCVG